MKKVKKSRTVVRWLRVKLGLCTDAKEFSGLSPAKAWAKASSYERYYVMKEVGWHHESLSCPACTPAAQANKVLPTKVLNAFRQWQRAA